jgi:fermentation-respiration switch protein FrsA (DUF1100 family)
MRRELELDAEGTVLRGWHYVPDASQGPVPTIVMAHGFSAVKEQYLDDYAASFAAAGLGAVVFDNRNFGASDGEPRQEIDPVQQIRDYRHAITYACTLPDVDGDRIGVWGTSFSGGHVLAVAAYDSRVKCVVSQVPTISGPDAALRRTRPDLMPGVLDALHGDRVARFAGAAPKTINVVQGDDKGPCALADEDSRRFFTESNLRAPAWKNEITLRSAEMAREYEPGTSIHRISPTPLLMIVADKDYVTPTDLALEAYERALQPKKLVLLKGGHFAPYIECFSESCGAATDWFCQHLKG